jgi:hypothetical protein
VGSTSLAWVDSHAEIGVSSEAAAAFVGATRRVLATRRGAELGKLLPAGGPVTRLTVGRLRDLGVGAGSFDLPITFTVRGVRTVAHLAVFNVEQVLGTVTAVGQPGRSVSVAVMTHLAKGMAGHMSAALMPVSTAPPAISGSPQAGQRLTATPGAWSGNLATYAYRWQRCDASGANCADIPASCVPGGSLCAAPPKVTEQSYIVTSRDSTNGSTIRVTVTATNSLGTATAVSAPTATVVPAPRAQWPTNTSAPTISGELHVGQTMTATTGAWTATPTSFVIVWQRCDPSNQPSCLPTGTGGGSLTYVVGSADQGFKMRVCVIAYNAAGGGSACSGRSEEIT